MKTNPNEPITTICSETLGQTIYDGLSKREHFASLALQGLCANYLRDNVQGWDVKTYAVEAVLLADELINQLNK